jgi:hypothetical protein
VAFHFSLLFFAVLHGGATNERWTGSAYAFALAFLARWNKKTGRSSQPYSE